MPPTGKPNNRETAILLEPGTQRLSSGLTLKSADGEKNISIQLLLETQKRSAVRRYWPVHLVKSVGFLAPRFARVKARST